MFLNYMLYAMEERGGASGMERVELLDYPTQVKVV